MKWAQAAAAGLCALAALSAAAAGPTAPAASAPPASPPALSAADLAAATARDHAQMMRQLGITRLRPGPSGDEHAPDHANYDKDQANPYPDWPDPLTGADGKPVTSARDWYQRRRPRIVEDFEREVYGRVPAHTPAVSWSAQVPEAGSVGGVAVNVTRLSGRLDNAADPAISVEIPVVLIKPARHTGPMPALILFTWGAPAFPLSRFSAEPVQQLVADGWAVALINPTAVQADNGAGLTRGVIGLVNKGARRKPDDWGALRAWAWGASRLLDRLSQDPDLDPRHIGIEGVSRYGKAALVAMAFDTRFYMVLVGSSGEGGAKPHRRNFGEAVESLTGPGEYHWMAGNFLKYGAAEARDGPRTAADLPVESSELIALCAPRLTFISYGSPAAGDALWLDQQGSYMATVAAGKVFRLLGARDLGVGDDYRHARKPDIGTGLLGGELAWRQHEGGHTDVPNFKYFIAWADRFMGRAAAH